LFQRSSGVLPRAETHPIPVITTSSIMAANIEKM
jgi:hypothetical protein